MYIRPPLEVTLNSHRRWGTSLTWAIDPYMVCGRVCVWMCGSGCGGSVDVGVWVGECVCVGVSVYVCACVLWKTKRLPLEHCLEQFLDLDNITAVIIAL